MLTVVKAGGSIAGDPAGIAQGIAALDGRVVVVHGGGAEVSRWYDRLDLPVEWRDGLRVTSPEGVEVTSMVLSGWVNKRLVAALLDAGADAVGLSGEDGALVEATPKAGGSLGRVGTVRCVRGELLLRLLAADLLPVVSPLSRGPGGRPLNVNADEAALAVAEALGADRLLVVSDVPGVLAGEGVVSGMTPAEARSLLDAGTVAGGMRVKLAQAIRGAEAGIEVRIGDGGLLDGATGTRIVPGSPSGSEDGPDALRAEAAS